MRALRVCTGTKAAAPASANCVERVAPIFGNGLMTNAFETCKANFSAEHPLESPICRELMQKRPMRAARRSVTAPL